MGCLNAYGGKFEEGVDADIASCALREFESESTAVTHKVYLTPAAEVSFYKGGGLVFKCYIYICWRWEGELKATEEMGQPEEHPLFDPPYERMMRGDRFWLPKVLAGERPFRARLYYSEDMEVVEKFEVCGPLF